MSKGLYVEKIMKLVESLGDGDSSIVDGYSSDDKDWAEALSSCYVHFRRREKDYKIYTENGNLYVSSSKPKVLSPKSQYIKEKIVKSDWFPVKTDKKEEVDDE